MRLVLGVPSKKVGGWNPRQMPDEGLLPECPRQKSKQTGRSKPLLPASQALSCVPIRGTSQEASGQKDKRRNETEFAEGQPQDPKSGERWAGAH